MKNLKFLKFWLTLGWLLTGSVVILSVIPLPPQPFGFHGEDKLAHFFVYAMIMLWFGLIYMPGRVYRNLGLGFILMGIVLEGVQGLTGYRTLSFFDMTANGLGVFFGWLLSKTRLSSALIHIERIVF